ncbi:metallophosphoesterase [Spirosoma sp. BT702]|uniref:Metallophosphoesterase n=1 Tax=Spirosoma profusum TaxID=2771354 RepID=A0A926XWE6_9BACT|nr:metallophosphoesterase [Spirosoma profusum]MBD2702049.1 metallophosphoesterase [Spirosoma profusum]
MKFSRFVIILYLLIFCQAVYAQNAKITRGPYLQVLTPTSVVVRWQTDQPTVGRIWYGPQTNQLNSNISESQSGVEHSLTIKGLQPSTRYAYAVGYDDKQLGAGDDYYVKTAPVPGDKQSIRLWALGDFGAGNDNQKNVYQSYLNATVNKRADVWVWLGDHAYCCGQEDEYNKYVFSAYPQTLRNLPIFTTPGNHDYADSEVNFNIPYYNLFSFPQQGEAGGVPSGSKSYFSADYGPVHLISLDSQGRQEGQFRLYDTTTTQVQWLKRDLAANKLPWTVVIFHHPPYSKGGRNSDTEEAMRLIRENLTPILERYGVDLVLNGHSHGYERTYRMKGHRGLANTYDKNAYVVENTTGRYDGSPNSCPILTKGQGTVYVVNGSGGQLGGQAVDYPHPAMLYYNNIIGGSMLLDVVENRLDAQFLTSDGSVRDRFTIMKNVAKTTALATEFGDTLQFSASWIGDYRWPGGQTGRSFRYVADKAGAFPISVTDGQQCLTDQFNVTVQAPPRLTAKATGTTSVCPGGTFTVTATPENTTKAAGWQYDVLLSDASGNFATERIVGSGTLATLKATIPAGLPVGSGYRVRVRPRGVPYAELVASDGFAIKAPPTATLTGPATVLQGQPASLTISLTGDGPWTGTLSNGSSLSAFSTTITPAVIPIQVTATTSYSIASVENACGKGTGSGQVAINFLPPKVTAKTVTSVCIGGSFDVTAVSENAYQPENWQYDIILSDATGNFSGDNLVGSGTLASLKATIPANVPAGSAYRVRVRPRGIANPQLVPSDPFTIKPLPTATLTGSMSVLQGQPASLSLAFTGDAPWQGSLSDGTNFLSSVTPTELRVRPAQTTTYSVASVENGCGKGTATGQALINVVIPTEAEKFAGGQLWIYPNPAHDVVRVELTLTQKKDVTLHLRDLQGRSVFQKPFGPVSSLTESIQMPDIVGTYLLTIQVGQEMLTRKIVRE